MAFPDTHSIQRQVFEFNVAEQEGSFEAMNRMKATFQQDILPLMEEVLDELNVPGMTIRLDRVEIDLGNLREDVLEEDFRFAVKRELRRELVEKLRSPGAKGLPSGVVLENEKAGSELFFHILENGALPWWSPPAAKSLSNMVEELLEKAPHFLQHRLPVLLQQAAIRKRLAIAVPTALMIDVLQLLNDAFPFDKSTIEGFLSELQFKLKPDGLSSSSFLEKAKASVWAGWDLRSPKALEKYCGDQLVAHGIRKGKGAGEEGASELAKDASDTVESSQKKARSTADPASIYIDNAGLVLLHPYLQILFQEFNLLDGTEFVNDGAKDKAMSLLRFLVWGDAEREEYQQSLDKIICGFLPEDAFSISLPLSPAEKSECIQLLEAINANWKPMSGTAAEDLRDAFLKREGRLTDTGEAWELKVDRKGWDILLDQLSWTIGIIKLPWMEKPLYVEW